jgi:plasmid stabilization system protein ParE
VSRRILFVPEAAAELEDATRWYEERRAGLGVAFLGAVDAAVESLVRWPGAGAPVTGLAQDLDVRRVPVSRYPYYVAYLVEDAVIHVLAIAHDRRRPVYWSGRAEGVT